MMIEFWSLFQPFKFETIQFSHLDWSTSFYYEDLSITMWKSEYEEFSIET